MRDRRLVTSGNNVTGKNIFFPGRRVVEMEVPAWERWNRSQTHWIASRNATSCDSGKIFCSGVGASGKRGRHFQVAAIAIGPRISGGYVPRCQPGPASLKNGLDQSGVFDLA